jgi:hypothetical protein
MAIVTRVSKKELERVAGIAYEGETINVMLCNVGLTGFTSESLVSDWQTVEVATANGYSRFSDTIQVGSYSAVSGAYVMPSVVAQFSSTGVGFGYDRIVVYIEGSIYPHSVITESPNIILVGGQTQTYRISLWQDD